MRKIQTTKQIKRQIHILKRAYTKIMSKKKDTRGFNLPYSYSHVIGKYACEVV